MPTEAEIKTRYKRQHDELSERYYKKHKLTKEQFNTQHGKVWDDMNTDLITEGYRQLPESPVDLLAKVEELEARVANLEKE